MCEQSLTHSYTHHIELVKVFFPNMLKCETPGCLPFIIYNTFRQNLIYKIPRFVL